MSDPCYCCRRPLAGDVHRVEAYTGKEEIVVLMCHECYIRFEKLLATAEQKPARLAKSA
jgi:hypothetical protein